MWLLKLWSQEEESVNFKMYSKHRIEVAIDKGNRGKSYHISSRSWALNCVDEKQPAASAGCQSEEDIYKITKRKDEGGSIEGHPI